MLTKRIKNVEIKASSEGNIFQVEAYASIFGNIDAGRDIVEKGAFTKTLQENNKRIKTLFNHDWNVIIGKPLEMVEDSKGLYTKTQFIDTPKSREIYELVKEDIVNELSIGYDIVKNEYDKPNKVNKLKELKLYEYSFVTFAMNEMAQVTDVKSLIDEIKAGRMLSDKNVSNIKEIINMLTALLDSNEKPEPLSSDTMGCTGEPKKSQQKEETIDYDSLLTQIKLINMR